MPQKIHFSFEPGKPEIKAFARSLINDLGQAPLKKADIIVTIGGDGSLLHAFPKLNDQQKIFGMVPPNSNSRGFWTNRDITNTEELLNALEKAKNYTVQPLKAKIFKEQGKPSIISAFNEVAPGEFSGQAMLINLTIHAPNRTIGPIRIMGDGLIMATPFGSTAVNRTYGGSAIDIRNAGISVVGKGIYEPANGFPPTVATDETRFEFEFLSPQKRPVRILYDGKSIISDRDNPITRMIVEKDPANAVQLMLTEGPSTRAFSAMMPK